MKRLDDISDRVRQSIVRNCRSYLARHGDYFDQRAYVQNLASLHNLDANELWAEVTR